MNQQAKKTSTIAFRLDDDIVKNYVQKIFCIIVSFTEEIKLANVAFGVCGFDHFNSSSICEN
ncbi:MAG: hypothetical protein ACREA3_06410 [Nitrosotalea sp.]